MLDGHQPSYDGRAIVQCGTCNSFITVEEQLESIWTCLSRPVRNIASPIGHKVPLTLFWASLSHAACAILGYRKYDSPAWRSLELSQAVALDVTTYLILAALYKSIESNWRYLLARSVSALLLWTVVESYVTIDLDLSVTLDLALFEQLLLRWGQLYLCLLGLLFGHGLCFLTVLALENGSKYALMAVQRSRRRVGWKFIA